MRSRRCWVPHCRAQTLVCQVAVQYKTELKLQVQVNLHDMYLCCKVHDGVDILGLENVLHKIQRLNVSLDKLHGPIESMRSETKVWGSKEIREKLNTGCRANAQKTILASRVHCFRRASVHVHNHFFPASNGSQRTDIVLP